MVRLMRTAIVLKGYPRLSETFIAQEILELEKRGLPIEIVSLRFPTDRITHPVHDEIKAPVRYLPEYLYKEMARVWHAWKIVRRWPSYKSTKDKWLADLRRDFTPNRIRRFGQALVLAAEMPADIEHLYAHFLHTPASVTRYAAALRGLPWSCSAHAVDIWTTPHWEIREKLRDLSWLVTCTGVNEGFLRNLAEDPSKVSLIYHGLDLSRFASEDPEIRPGSPVRLLSVGRAVEKKGYQDLLTALASLPNDVDWTFTHIGGGPLLKKLKRVAKALNLDRRITWMGSQSQEAVIHAYQNADIFVLPCKIAGNGDRDGLPNVLMEAQSQGLACISTRVSAIPELILHEETGLLAEPGDPEDLARQIKHLITDFEFRRDLAMAGRQRVRSKFSFSNCVGPLAEKFGLPMSAGIDKVA